MFSWPTPTQYYALKMITSSFWQKNWPKIILIKKVCIVAHPTSCNVVRDSLPISSTVYIVDWVRVASYLHVHNISSIFCTRYFTKFNQNTHDERPVYLLVCYMDQVSHVRCHVTNTEVKVHWPNTAQEEDDKCNPTNEPENEPMESLWLTWVRCVKNKNMWTLCVIAWPVHFLFIFVKSAWLRNSPHQALKSEILNAV